MKIIACGGDGTVGWVLQGIDEFYKDKPDHPRPYVSIYPVGHSNDLSRALNWGGKYQDKPLKKILSDTVKADKTKFDRWDLNVSIPQDSEVDITYNSNYTDGEAKVSKKLPLAVMNNYISLGIDGQISLIFITPEKPILRSSNRERRI